MLATQGWPVLPGSGVQSSASGLRVLLSSPVRAMLVLPPSPGREWSQPRARAPGLPGHRPEGPRSPCKAVGAPRPGGKWEASHRRAGGGWQASALLARQGQSQLWAAVLGPPGHKGMCPLPGGNWDPALWSALSSRRPAGRCLPPPSPTRKGRASVSSLVGSVTWQTRGPSVWLCVSCRASTSQQGLVGQSTEVTLHRG